MAKVFVSHRSTDSAVAERLANAIREAGHEVHLDIWDLSIGDSIVAWMDEGLRGARFVVLCYSDAGIASPWMSREWLSTLARQLSGENVKLLPVLLTGGAPPAILADIKYANLVKDWNQGIADLLAAMV